MVEGRPAKAAEAREAQRPLRFSHKRFESTPEFANFKDGMRRLLAVSKTEVDEMGSKAKETSPRAGNPKAAGRKPKKIKEY